MKIIPKYSKYITCRNATCVNPYGILQPQLLAEMPRSPPPRRGYETPVKRQHVRVANEPDQGWNTEGQWFVGTVETNLNLQGMDTYPTWGSWENHLQNGIFGGYVSFLEGKPSESKGSKVKTTVSWYQVDNHLFKKHEDMPSQHVYNWQKAIYRLELEFKRVVFCSSASSLLQTKQLRAIQTLEAICVRHLELLLDVLHSSTLPKILHLLQTVQVFTWAPEGGILHIYWNDRWSFWVNLTILTKAPLPATLSNTHVWFIFQGHGGAPCKTGSSTPQHLSHSPSFGSSCTSCVEKVLKILVTFKSETAW